MYETILWEKEGEISIIRLNRPEKKNALSIKMKQELNEVLDQLSVDKAIRVIILTGGQDCFCVGADVKEPDGISKLVKEDPIYRITHRWDTIHTKIERLPKPTVAAISGLALGGGLEMALACDLRIASEAAEFGFPEIKIGGLPAGGGTQRLPRMVGVGKAKEMILLGKTINAAEAYRIGLVNEVVPPNRLIEEAMQIASVLAERPPLALTLAKYVINTGMQMDLNSALDYEASFVTRLYGTEDRAEGIRAFSEKRKPIFKGK